MDKVLIGVVAGGLAALGAYLILSSRKSGDKNNEMKDVNYQILKFSDVVAESKNLIEDQEIPANQKLVLLKNDENYILAFFDTLKNEVVEKKSIVITCTGIDETLKLAFGDKEMLILEQ